MAIVIATLQGIGQTPVSCKGINSMPPNNQPKGNTMSSKKTAVSNVMPASGREANPIIKAGKFDGTGLSIPGLNFSSTNMTFIQDALLLGLCKILSDELAGSSNTAADIIATIDAWRDGYVSVGAKKKALKALSETVTSGKSGKLGYSQLQVCSALRATLGADDPRISIIEGFNDERFSQFMALKSGESYMVDALTFLRKQDEEKAKLEADKLAAELAALGL